MAQQNGMSNADFARLFRQEERTKVRQEAQEDVKNGDENAQESNGADAWPPRRGIGMGLGSQSPTRGLGMNTSPDRAGLGSFRRAIGMKDQEDEDNPTARTRLGSARRGIGTQDESQPPPEPMHGGLSSFRQGATIEGKFTAAISTQESTTESQKSMNNEANDKSKKPAKSVKPPKFGWEKYSKGFGSKMMAKMGFTGRLGKHEQGVSGTIQVKQRPNQMGLGFGNFVEASALKQNQKLQKELQGETIEDEEKNRKKRKHEDLEDDSLWRKRKVVTKKYKKASEITQEALQEKHKRKELIVDMRGPDVRVLADISDAYDQQIDVDEALEAHKPKLGDELIYNVRMVVNLSQGKICDLTQKIATNKDLVTNMRKETTIIQRQVDVEAVRLQRVGDVMARLQTLESIATTTMESMDVEPIVKVLRSLRVEFPQEFESYRLAQLGPSLSIPVLQALVSSCSIGTKYDRKRIVKQYELIQRFLLAPNQDDSKADPQDPVSGVFRQHQIREKNCADGELLYNFILEETLWSSVVHYVNVHWEATTDPLACIDLFLQLEPHLSTAFAHAFLQQLVVPRLKKECHRSMSLEHAIAINQWLLPWKQLIGPSAFESLLPDVQLCLGAAMNQWHPSEASIVEAIAPWRELWGEQAYATFTNKHVVRKLIRALHREFDINPQNQSLDALKWILVWKDQLPERQIVALLEGEFFPKWLHVLRRWVADDPDLLELEKWYCGWKKFFTKANHLATHRRLVVHFHGALVLLRVASENVVNTSNNETTRPIPELNDAAPKSYQEALVRAKQDDHGVDEKQQAERQRAEQQKRQASAKRTSHQQHLGMKDVIEHLAISHNLLFMPKGMHDGQQVYEFGKHHILIEQGVVYVEREKGSYKPVDLDDLL